MNFIDRQAANPNRRKIKNITTNEEFIADIERTEQEMVTVGGTALKADVLNKGNWRDDYSISFEKRADNVLPLADATKTQIVTKNNGEIWFIPPSNSGEAIKICEKGNEGKSTLYLKENINSEINTITSVNYLNFNSTPKIGDIIFSQNNCLGIVNSLTDTSVNIKTERYLFHYDLTNPANVITEDILATKLLMLIYPVGSIYMSVNNVSPQLFLGGMWELWGSGRVAVGVNVNDINFDSAEKTGGSSNSILPLHFHNVNSSLLLKTKHAGSASGSANFSFVRTANGPYNSDSGVLKTSVPGIGVGPTGGSAGRSATLMLELNIPGHIHDIDPHTHTTNSIGESVTNKNLQPYITCYMWKRTV